MKGDVKAQKRTSRTYGLGNDGTERWKLELGPKRRTDDM